MQERREIRFNDGRFPARSWEGSRAVERRDSGINSVSPPNEEILIVDVEDDVDPLVTKGNAALQREESQPAFNPASQHRWFPETSSNSSSDETSDDSSPAHPNLRRSQYVEDEETIMSKRILVDKLFIKEDVGFRCRACE